MSALSLLSQLPSSLVSSLRSWLSTLPSSDSVLPSIPKSVKLLLAALLILNSSSFPFLWHIRVFYHLIRLNAIQRYKGRRKFLTEWKADIDARGGLRGVRVTDKRRAWFDDCDYNMHLSNSCYSKNSDPVKFKYAINAFAPAFASGSFMALGATHWNFFKEVPIGSEYVMETRLAGWDEKWMFLVTEFITYPKKRSSRSRAATTRDAAAGAITDAHLLPTVTAPPTRSSSPVPSGTATPAGAAGVSNNRVEEIKKAWVARRAANPREDGGVVCCLSISEHCVKIGRITIPPRIALWGCLYSPSKTEQDRAKAVLMLPDGGAKFFTGGWRNEPNADSLGMDVSPAEVGEEGVWWQDGADAMAKVLEGESVF
ncbi:hypothetical protein IAT38_003355 [Cryptococcus sp. DSM 104549]